MPEAEPEPAIEFLPMFGTPTKTVEVASNVLTLHDGPSTSDPVNITLDLTDPGSDTLGEVAMALDTAFGVAASVSVASGVDPSSTSVSLVDQVRQWTQFGGPPLTALFG